MPKAKLFKNEAGSIINEMKVNKVKVEISNRTLEPNQENTVFCQHYFLTFLS